MSQLATSKDAATQLANVQGRTSILRRAARAFRALRTHTEGVSAVEFGLLAPVFFLMLIGGFDLLHSLYTQTMLRGAIEDAARGSALETGSIGLIDAEVAEIMEPVIPGAKIVTTRMSYYDFKDIGRPEQWTDANRDGICNRGEPFIDENNNGRWDKDVGSNDNGAASDVVIYTVKATYNPPFIVPFIDSLQEPRTMSAQTVVKNQPYGKQEKAGTESFTCD